MTVKEYFKDWYPIIDKAELKKVIDKLKTYNHITPGYRDIFRSFYLCDYRNLKVIILGQDPYPQVNIATGIAFGVNHEPIPASLEVIKNTVENLSMPNYCSNFDITLESWEKQGVLLLNSALTTEVNKIGVHYTLWRNFIKNLLLKIGEYNPGMIYLLMGEIAKSFIPFIDSRFNDIITVKHPSYYARTNTDMPDVFSHINKLLKGKYNQTINWIEKL